MDRCPYNVHISLMKDDIPREKLPDPALDNLSTNVGAKITIHSKLVNGLTRRKIGQVPKLDQINSDRSPRIERKTVL